MRHNFTGLIYRISTLNCGEEDFAVARLRSNLRYGKNQRKEDVKSHHSTSSALTHGTERTTV